MAYIRQLEHDEVTGPLKNVYDAAMKRAGRVSSIVRLMSLNGDVAKASLDYYITLMKRKNALSPSRREMLAAVVSNINGCYY